MLLKLLAYDNEDQRELLPDKWEIEHILPEGQEFISQMFQKKMLTIPLNI